MKKIFALFGFLFMFGIAHASDYLVGQVWSYKTRPGEEHSTLLINKIEVNEKMGRIFHISVERVRVRNRHSKSGFATALPHFPVSEETLNKSVVKVVRMTAPNPQYIEGYKTWKAAFDAGNAGVFTISISEIVDHVEKVINQP